MSQEVPQDSVSAGVHSLDEALKGMTWRVEEGRFGLLGFLEPPGPAASALLAGEGPVQVIREGGETTCLARLEALEALRSEHSNARVEAPLAWIRFELPMAWDLVGFLAQVTSALAEAGVSVGAVCGFSRDHLFVAESRLDAACAALEQLLGPQASDQA